jgi:hypothetical protein
LDLKKWIFLFYLHSGEKSYRKQEEDILAQVEKLNLSFFPQDKVLFRKSIYFSRIYMAKVSGAKTFHPY